MEQGTNRDGIGKLARFDVSPPAERSARSRPAGERTAAQLVGRLPPSRTRTQPLRRGTPPPRFSGSAPADSCSIRCNTAVASSLRWKRMMR